MVAMGNRRRVTPVAEKGKRDASGERNQKSWHGGVAVRTAPESPVPIPGGKFHGLPAGPEPEA
jgi:hypothetical protein